MSVIGFHGEYRATSAYRAHQNETSIGHIAQQCDELLKMLNRSPHTMNLGALMDRGSAIVRSRRRLADPNGVGFGDLFDAEVKAALMTAHPAQYPDLSTINAEYLQFRTLVDAVIASGRAVYDAEVSARGGKTIDLDGDNQPDDPPVSVSVAQLKTDLTALRAFIRKDPSE